MKKILISRTIVAMACAVGVSIAVLPAKAERKDNTTSIKPSAAIRSAVAADSRSEDNRKRDIYRNPAETLAFFGVTGDDVIVEIWPGRGWYSEILAPFSKAGGGTLYVGASWERGLRHIRAKQAENPDVYSAVKFAEYPSTGEHPTTPDGSADVVLTFRNVHNWRFAGSDATLAAFQQFYTMLKPGGVLGVVEHRLNESDADAKEEKSGYMKESSVIAFAKAAGFRLVGRSEINANPKDSKYHPHGVWSLPPVLRGGDNNRAAYLAMGESDRMTLKFVKPAP